MSIRTISLFAAALLIIAPVFGRPDSSRAIEPPTPFRDIDGSIFAGDIAWLYASGISRGCAADRFCPNEVVTRGQFATFLARMLELPAAQRDHFKDDDGSSFEADINRVAAARVTRGCAENRFCPDQQVTRDQMASLLVRANNIEGRPRADYFWDDAASDHERAINRLASAGLTQGCGTGRYCPSSPVTRGQMAAFLHRTVRSEAPEPPTPAPSPPTPTPPPTASPSPVPTPDPMPSVVPPSPTVAPSVAPTVAPTVTPTVAPSVAPTVAPTIAPPVVPPPVGVAGYGASTAGGTGGRVARVTNLNDGGAGSLRAAVESAGARTVVFNVAGTINLASDLRVSDPFLTVDGSSAPGPVVIRGAAVKVITHDVILRQLRMRPGDQVAAPADVDAVTINGMTGEVYNVVLDHLSMVWGPDVGGLAILGNVHDVTVQYSIMGEGLRLSRHPEATTASGGHSKATSIFQLDPGVQWARRLTFHHNLFTTSDDRMPIVQGAECVDLINNVVYNWGDNGLTGNPRTMNVVNNWFRTGPITSSRLVYEWRQHSANPNPYAGSVYLAGNVADGFTSAVQAPSGVVRTSVACGGLSVNAETAQNGYNTVVGAAGATQPSRDSVDQRIIGNLLNRTGSAFNGVGYPAPNPYYP